VNKPTPLALSAARQLYPDAQADGGAAPGPARLADLGMPLSRPAPVRTPGLATASTGAVRRSMTRQTGTRYALQGIHDGIAFAAGAATAAPTTTRPATAGIDGADGYPPMERIPVAGMRRVIAERLAASKRDAPHYYMSAECLADPLLAMRRDLNMVLPAEERLSVNDLVLKLVAHCLARHPGLNAAWDVDTIVRFAHVNLAVAVAVEGGLVTPVLRGAERLGLRQIRAEMTALVDAARRRALPREAFQGGTFTVSNLGMYPVSQFAAIVNPPQAAILAVAGAQRRVVALDDERSAVRRVMTVTLSVDHRVADGVAGAEFLADFKALVEEPRRALL